MNRPLCHALLVLLCCLPRLWSAPHWEAPDLLPVKLGPAPTHAPVLLAADGQSRVTVVQADPKPSRELSEAVTLLVKCLEQATGAKPLVATELPATGAAIVVGAHPAALAAGLAPDKLPPEGFVIQTAAERIYIVGAAAPAAGTAWGVYEFLERFVGVRWYFPEPEYGLIVPRTPTLAVPPVSLSDAPVFRMRIIWPDMSSPGNGRGIQLGGLHRWLRKGNSWPTTLKVHHPNWEKVTEYRDKYPQVYQLKADGTRDYMMLCYGNPKTLELYLDNIDRHIKGDKTAVIGIADQAITVSPNDAEVVCYCPDCRALWDADGGMYGTASKVVGAFTAKLAGVVKQRWPDYTVIYLPYLNYTLPPKGVTFPDNVEIQLCGMPGMAMYAQESVAREEQATLDTWYQLSGRKLQNWHYSCWPADRTQVPMQYPYTIQRYYQHNRDKLVGTFINGVADHWPRQNLTLYVWLKCLWQPEAPVAAIIDEFCARAFGAAAPVMRQVVQTQIERWEKVPWPGGRLSRKAAFELSFPPELAKQMATQLAEARALVKDDPLASRRLEYYAADLEVFFTASRNFAEGAGLVPLVMQKVGDAPKVDGLLDDAAWQRATPNAFVRATDRKVKEPVYPSEVRAVWTLSGLYLAFKLSEPTPAKLAVENGGTDNPSLWWDDNVELLFDVTGRNDGEYYHLMFNAKDGRYDGKGKDLAWTCAGLQYASKVAADHWSLEVYLPYSAFPDAVKPGGGAIVAWSGNFTRHRVADSRAMTAERTPGSTREYTRMNTTYASFSNNLEDFATWQFQE